VKLLTRIKTFVATGLATAGRLYAGDLNQIQDGVAAYSDYNQRVDVATLGIGEVALALLHYGTGEARITGALRTDGILRGLGGLFAGQYTSAQRDAIPANGAPYGLIVFNTTTNRFEWNKGNDQSRQWTAFGVTVERNGANPVSESGINFIQGSGITLTVADNPGTNYVDVTITAGAQAVGGTIPIGGIIEWSAAGDPTNYLVCDGRSLVRTTPYDQLFAVIGTSFGAVDGSHYSIPDFRGRCGYGPNGGTVPLAGTEGIATPTQRGPSHSHTYSAPLTPHGGYTETGQNPGAQLNPGITSGSTYNQDQGAWLGMYRAIRYQ
jgi:microcystin-dependent protein